MTTSWGPFAKKPNILIIMTDQQRTAQHFPKGWVEENLPCLHNLQSTGVTFEQGMASSTACSPSRSTIFTSTYPVNDGVRKVGDSLVCEDQLLPTGGQLTTLGQVMGRAGSTWNTRVNGTWTRVSLMHRACGPSSKN